MRLNYVEIRNFRSIEYAKIDFDPRCRILVGINESGKSNILKAINVLSEAADTPFDENDKRQMLKGEGELKTSFLKFNFIFEKNDIEELREELSKEILIKDETDSISRQEKKFRNFYSKNIQCELFVDYLEKKRTFHDPNLSSMLEKDKYELFQHLKKVNKDSSTPLITNYNGQDVDIRTFSFTNIKKSEEIHQENFEEIEKEKFLGEIFNLRENKIHEITKKNFPKINFWEFSKENILPPSVDCQTFADNPDSCLPLKNMFHFNKDFNIKEAFEQHKSNTSDTDTNFDNYLARVAHKTTEYFREIWQDYKDITFTLSESGGKIRCRVDSGIKYNFDQRSDGFLRFFSFLSMVAIEIKSGNIKNNILLIDEPEMGLHPSSVRHLLQELIKISKNNIVVISTHSTFMIDKQEIQRHLVIEKKEEKTIVKSASKSNFFTEEILHNALGTSMFDVMKAEILLFEGYWDRKLFEIFTETKKIRNMFDHIGIAHGVGVDNMHHMLTQFSLVSKKCLIVSDNDSAAKRGQKKHSEEKQFGTWKKYSNFPGNLKEKTGEDFIKNEAIKKAISNTIIFFKKNKENKNFSFKEEMEEIALKETDKIKDIKSWIYRNINIDQRDRKHLQKETVHFIVDKVKSSLFDNIDGKNITNSYAKLVKGIAKIFKIETNELNSIIKKEKTSDPTNNSHSAPPRQQKNLSHGS